jgi:TPP-dependent pyruvate/acetoin dehydrogenase alpha subunit
LILNTARFGPHSKGDDTRPQEVLDDLRQTRDPVKIQAGQMPPADVQAIEQEVESEIAAAFQQASIDPFPVLEAAR